MRKKRWWWRRETQNYSLPEFNFGWMKLIANELFCCSLVVASFLLWLLLLLVQVWGCNWIDWTFFFIHITKDEEAKFLEFFFFSLSVVLLPTHIIYKLNKWWLKLVSVLLLWHLNINQFKIVYNEYWKINNFFFFDLCDQEIRS